MRARRARSRRWRPARRSSSNGGSAIDAVEAAVRVLEEDACFNAGRGSVLTATGCIELDAAIMDGRTRRAGAVAGLGRRARRSASRGGCMEHGPHVFLSGTAPTSSRARQGSSRSTTTGSRLPERRRQLDELLARRRVRRRSEIRHRRRGRGRRRRPCRGRDLDRRTDRQALGPGRRFAADRRRHLCRRPLRRGVGDRARANISSAPSRRTSLPERVRLGGQSLQQALDAVLADIASLGGKGGLIAVAPNGRGGVGLHHAGDVPRNGRLERADRRDLFRRGRAVGQVPPQPFDLRRDGRALVSRKSATASRKLRLGMKCAERVITGS